MFRRVAAANDEIAVRRITAGLAADRWYALRFTASSAYKVSPLDTVRAQADVVFFTGSALRLRRLERTKNIKGGGRCVSVRLSEPVAIATLNPFGGDPNLAGCVYCGSACLDAGDPLTMAGFEWRFTTPLTTDPGISRVVLSNDGGVEYLTPANEWFPCSGEALTECWETPSPLQ